MVVRVDTTNLTRGLDFSVIIYTNSEPTVSLYAFNTSTHIIETLESELIHGESFFKSLSKAPYFDGFLLAKINSKSMVVKKIGHPTPHFVIGYKENYTVPYKLFDEAGVELKAGNLKNIVDGFYYCEIGSNVTVMETLKKRFIIKDNITKLNYGTTMENATLSEVSLPNYELNTTLSEVTLPYVVLAEMNVESILPDVEITEY